MDCTYWVQDSHVGKVRCGWRFDFTIGVPPMNEVLEVLKALASIASIARFLFLLWKEHKQKDG